MKHRITVMIRCMTLLVCLCLILTGCSSSGKIRIGTAGIGGNYYTFGQTLSELLRADDEKLDIEVKVTAGSAANLRLISQDYLQLAIAQTDLISNAVNAAGVFEGSEPLSGFSAVTGLYTEACQIIVSADSDIETVRDLKGKKISIGEAESGTEQNALEILSAYGLSDKIVTEVNMNYTDAADALKKGEIDAFFCTAGVQTTVVEELARQHDIRLLPVDGEEADMLLSEYNFYTAYTIPAGTYTGQDADTDTLGIRAVLIASDELSEDTVKQITQGIFDHASQLQYSVPVDFTLTPEEGTRDMPAPFHKGAAAYYEEQGITVDTAE